MQRLLAFIIGLLIVAIFFRVDFFFYLLYFFFGTYFVSLWWVDRNLSRLKITREYTNRAFVGDHVGVTLRVHNDSWLPVPWLRLHESLPIHLISPHFFWAVVSLLPQQERQLDYELNCRRRGYYVLGPLSYVTGDLLGIRSVERSQDVTQELIVYPRIHHLEKLGLQAQSPLGQIATRERLMEDPSRMIGVRPYQPSDSLRHIHWKTTAVTGALQVKRFEPAISVEAQILVNLQRTGYTTNRYVTASELAIEIAASMANHLIDRRQTVGITTNGRDPLDPEDRVPGLPPRKGRGHLMRILDLLGRVTLQEEHGFEPALRNVRQYLGWGGTAIVITPDLDDETLATLLLVKRQGLRTMLVLVDPHGSLQQTRSRVEQVGIPCHVIWREEDLDVWR